MQGVNCLVADVAKGANFDWLLLQRWGWLRRDFLKLSDQGGLHIE